MQASVRVKTDRSGLDYVYGPSTEPFFTRTGGLAGLLAGEKHATICPSRSLGYITCPQALDDILNKILRSSHCDGLSNCHNSDPASADPLFTFVLVEPALCLVPGVDRAIRRAVATLGQAGHRLGLGMAASALGEGADSARILKSWMYALSDAGAAFMISYDGGRRDHKVAAEYERFATFARYVPASLGLGEDVNGSALGRSSREFAAVCDQLHSRNVALLCSDVTSKWQLEAVLGMPFRFLSGKAVAPSHLNRSDPITLKV